MHVLRGLGTGEGAGEGGGSQNIALVRVVHCASASVDASFAKAGDGKLDVR